ncbi:ROK family transcriptional regulator [Corynebacterium meitnerae]|uniref:ROK family protein n=1 Tax=Corynebacterium meitnerae TaxID=2913498 RepID=A0A9X3RJR0_9CORY|nr:ROK family transcriptional regulator [Corynebacterium meitnerae]MCZ9294275.1 ROK family protein [Corynebacterium meitnerae]
MKTQWSAFSRPHNPTAKCLHLVRLNPVTSRSELVTATGLSQPTVTRAIAALMDAGYVTERTDLTRSQGRGRPIIPLELTDTQAVHAGIAVGTGSTYVALFDIKGRTIRDSELDIHVADMSQDDFIQHIMAGLNRLMADLSRPLATVGVTTSGSVSPDGVVNAPNLGWKDAPFGSEMREQFSVPVQVTSAVSAIVGSEIQSALTIDGAPMMALFADDSIGAAVTQDKGVLPIAVDRPDLTTHGVLGEQSLVSAVQAAQSDAALRKVLDERAETIGKLAAELMQEHSTPALVVAGSALIDDPAAPALFARSVRSVLPEASLRMIPTHREMVRDIARAVALDLVLREPLSVTTP